MSVSLSRRCFLVSAAGTLCMATVADIARAGGEAAPRRRALLVAVESYSRGNRPDSLWDLNTLSDVQQLKAVLMDKLHFPETSIRVLNTKDSTTRQAILDALKKFIEDTREGDILYFHYSGHGSQVEDPTDALGFDQTLVPSDYVSTTNGSRDIRDKELANILKGVKAKRPAAFLLTFDSCHSGTITRAGGALKRGFDRVLAANIATMLKNRGGLVSAKVIATQGFTAISACQSDETNYETTGDTGAPMGSLTYALCRSLATATDQTTYRDLFEQITTVMHARGLCQQTPVMEGPLNQTLLGGKIIDPARFILVQTEEANGQKNALLMAGRWMGIAEGSKLDLWPALTNDFKDRSRLLGTATVTATEPTRARLGVTYENGNTFKDLASARALLTEIKYTERPLQVDLSLLKGHPRLGKIEDRLQELVKTGFITLSDTGKKWDIQISPASVAFAGTVGQPRQVGNAPDRWELEVRPRERGTTAPRRIQLWGANPSLPGTVVLLRGSDGSCLSTKLDKTHFLQLLEEDAHLPDLVCESLRRETRFRFMSELPSKAGGPNIHVELRIILCEVDKDGVYRKDIGELRPGRDGLLKPKVGDYFRLEIRNTSDLPAYVTIADLRADGGIGALWPDPGSVAVDNRVMPGKEWLPIRVQADEYMLYRFAEPIGSETITVIATPEQADYSLLFDEDTLKETLSRGPIPEGSRGGRESRSPFGRLLSNATTRTANNVATTDTNWQAIPIHIDLQPAPNK